MQKLHSRAEYKIIFHIDHWIQLPTPHPPDHISFHDNEPFDSLASQAPTKSCLVGNRSIAMRPKDLDEWGKASAISPQAEMLLWTADWEHSTRAEKASPRALEVGSLLDN